MSQREQAPPSTPLRRALEAEREARRDIEQAELEARERVDAARARVREIERLAEARIGKVTRGAKAETERQLTRLIEQKHAALDQLERAPEDADAIERAARRVAGYLAGEPSAQSDQGQGSADD